jgi:hypothetical protein
VVLATPTAAQSHLSQEADATVPPLLAMFPVASKIHVAPWMPESLWTQDDEHLDDEHHKEVSVHFTRAAHSKHFQSRLVQTLNLV